MPKKQTLEELEAKEKKQRQRLERTRQEIREERKKAAAEKRKLETKRKCEGTEKIEHYAGRHLTRNEFKILAQIARYLFAMPDGSHRLDSGETTIYNGKDIHKYVVDAIEDASKVAESNYQAMRARGGRGSGTGQPRALHRRGGA